MKNIIFILLSIIVLGSCHSGKNGTTHLEKTTPKDYVPGELLVIFKRQDTYEATIKQMENHAGVKLKKMLMVSPPDAIIGHFNVPKGKEKEYISIFQNHPEVNHVELNAIGSYIDFSASDLPILKVSKIEQEKDGYTVYLNDEKLSKYTMVVSLSNLGDKYVKLEVGDKIQVSGEYAESNPIQIFAKQIHVLNSTGTNKDDFIKGTIESIQLGKDGYTAKIKTTNNDIYFATISIPNFGKEGAHQFRSVSKGETIEVKGDLWSMGDEQRITVRTMKPAENVLIVSAKQVDCEGVAPQKCLLVKNAGAKDWENFYGDIEGFNYEPGYEYVLEIRKIRLKNPPADASSIKIVLVKQRSKTPKTSAQ